MKTTIIEQIGQTSEKKIIFIWLWARHSYTTK